MGCPWESLELRKTIAEWINSMPAENLPSELHLSHNRITPSGFHILVQAIELCLQGGFLSLFSCALHFSNADVLGGCQGAVGSLEVTHTREGIMGWN